MVGEAVSWLPRGSPRGTLGGLHVVDPASAACRGAAGTATARADLAAVPAGATRIAGAQAPIATGTASTLTATDCAMAAVFRVGRHRVARKLTPGGIAGSAGDGQRRREGNGAGAELPGVSRSRPSSSGSRWQATQDGHRRNPFQGAVNPIVTRDAADVPARRLPARSPLPLLAR